MIFINNKYTRRYNSIIYKAFARSLPPESYTEKHHIIPKSLGGTNKRDNLVKLTAREHFVCHRLLTKMTTGQARQKMSFAMLKLCHTRTRVLPISARTYTIIKKDHASAMSKLRRGSKATFSKSQETREKLSAALKGKPKSAEHRAKLKGPKSAEHRKNMCGRVVSDETREKLSNSRIGKTASIESRVKMSVSAKSKPLVSPKTRQALSCALSNRELSAEHKTALSNMQKNLPLMSCVKCRKTVNQRVFNRYHKNC